MTKRAKVGMEAFWKWLWWTPGLLLTAVAVQAQETQPRVKLRVDEPSTGSLTLRLVVPEGGIYSGRYSSLDRVVIDIHKDLEPGLYDMRFGPTPVPDCPDCSDSCQNAHPEGELVRIYATECLPSSPGVRAWEGTVTTQAPAPRVEGLWRCAVEVPDPDQPGRCGEARR